MHNKAHAQPINRVVSVDKEEEEKTEAAQSVPKTGQQQ